MSGQYGDLSSEQQATLEEMKFLFAETFRKHPDLKRQLQLVLLDGEPEDRIYLRFLRARKFKLDDSFNLMFDCLKWRRDFHGKGVFAIKEDDIEEDLVAGKVIPCGHDKDGLPVSYIFVNLHDRSTPLNRTEELCVYSFETGRLRLKYPQEKVTVVFDLKGFSMKNVDFPFTKFMFSLFESRYPECLALCLVVDAPLIFSTVWRVIQAWIDPVTRSKIQFVSREEVSKFINADQLLTSFGGNNDFKYVYERPNTPTLADKEELLRLPIDVDISDYLKKQKRRSLEGENGDAHLSSKKKHTTVKRVKSIKVHGNESIKQETIDEDVETTVVLRSKSPEKHKKKELNNNNKNKNNNNNNNNNKEEEGEVEDDQLTTVVTKDHHHSVTTTTTSKPQSQQSPVRSSQAHLRHQHQQVARELELVSMNDSPHSLLHQILLIVFSVSVLSVLAYLVTDHH